MLTFTDYYHNQVELSFTYYPFSDTPLHVWVVARYGDKWVLTKHKQRGLEFPGGKERRGASSNRSITSANIGCSDEVTRS